MLTHGKNTTNGNGGGGKTTKKLLDLVLSKNTLMHVGIGLSSVIMISLAAYQSECEFGHCLLAMVGKKKDSKSKEEEIATKKKTDDKTKIE